MATEQLWATFDAKVGELGRKASELETIKGKIEPLPARLSTVKTQIQSLISNAKGTMSGTMKKDIEKKVESLDKIIKRIDNTKKANDPVLNQLETAVKGLEDYTKDAGATPEVTGTINASGLFNTPKPAASPATPSASVKDVIPPPTSTAGPFVPAKTASTLNPNAKPFQSSTSTKPVSTLNPNAKPFQPGTKTGGRKTKKGGYLARKLYSRKKSMQKKYAKKSVKSGMKSSNRTRSSKHK